MPPLNLTELEAALEKATPGPWEIKEDTCNGKEEAWCYWHMVGPLDLQGAHANDNDRLIVLLRNQAPALLAELKALRKAVEAYQGMDVEDIREVDFGDVIFDSEQDAVNFLWRSEKDIITKRLNEELGKI